MVELIKKGIEKDLYLGVYDESQLKYKKWITERTVAEQLQPKCQELPFDEHLMLWMDATDRNDSKDVYHYTYTMVRNWVRDGRDVQAMRLPGLLGSMNYAAKTYNNRRFVLNLFCNWLVKRKFIEYNPFDDVAIKRRKVGKDPKRKRLTDSEISNILVAIKDDRFQKPNNRGYTHSHYYSIFCFLIFTGCRPAEAIGLTVKKVDFNRKAITIDSAFARTRKGTSFACRRMKGTKTEEIRELPFEENSMLYAVLKKECEGKKANDFVFKGPDGPTCDDRKMNDTVLKNVLEGLNIPPRVLYCFRHSFCSRCFEQGMDIKSVQALTGHRDVTVLLNIYAEVTHKKVCIPELNIV
ncbi:tyrosine-type recombinase/integrase [Segetibacter aerophilus]|nr:site-specific integrase [Segetibacter aerophilus]